MQQLRSRPYPGQASGLMHIDRDKRLYFFCKRCIDIVLSMLFLVVTLPLLLLIALLIKLDSPGPVLFRQERVGAQKSSIAREEASQLRTFIMFKFRTMYHNSHPGIHQRFVSALIRGNETEAARLRNNSAVNKLTNDPRVTRVGKVLRRTRLDELPQVWNVLRGDMSLVGPRPPIAYEVAEYEPHHWRRLGTIPGCVGLWQVSGWCTVGFEEMVELDTWYIEHQSLWLDLKILLRTPQAVLSGKGGA